MKAYIAELIGTALFVMIGCGAMIFGAGSLGLLGIALAFGLGYMIVGYLIDGISGAHVNPAITIAMALSGKFSWAKALGYIVAQIVGAVFGSLILFAIVSNIANSTLIINAGFGTNALNSGVSMMGGALIEVFMTLVFCLVFLDTTRANWSNSRSLVPIVTGLTLAATYIVAIPLTGASLNPARSIGPALVSQQNLGSLGLFILAPIVGAVLAYFIHIFIFGREYHRRAEQN